MLQNIRILVGEIPRSTGNLTADYEALKGFLERLMKGLEHSFTNLDIRLEAVEKETGAVKSDE